jgi:hypothetical protein
MAKTASNPADRKMEHVDITQSEEMPVLSSKEKSEFVRSLQDSQAQIERGECVRFKKPGDFGKWMSERLAFYRANHGA